jgi:hypothetical protein
VNRPGAAHRHHGSAHLAAEEAAVGLGNQAGAVHQGFDLRRDVGHIGRRAEQDAVRLPPSFRSGHCPCRPFARSGGPSFREHFAAGQAAVNLGPAQFNQFGFDPFVFQFLQHAAQQDGRVSALAGAAVQRNNLDLSATMRFSSAPRLTSPAKCPGGRSALLSQRGRPLALAGSDLQHSSSCVPYNIPIEVVIELAQHPNIVGHQGLQRQHRADSRRVERRPARRPAVRSPLRRSLRR